MLGYLGIAQSNGNIISLPLPYTISQKGSLLFAWSSANYANSLSDTLGHNWIPLTLSYQSLWYAISKGSGLTTLTFGYPSTSPNTNAVAVVEYGSIPVVPNLALVLDNFVMTNFPANAPSFSQALSLAYANEVIVVMGNLYGANVGYFSTSGDTMRMQNYQYGCFVCDRPSTTPGVYTESANPGGGTPYGSAVFYLSVAVASARQRAIEGVGV